MDQSNVNLVSLNPQPLPPAATINLVALNPQPLPPDTKIELIAAAASGRDDQPLALNPPPPPPGRTHQAPRP